MATAIFSIFRFRRIFSVKLRKTFDFDFLVGFSMYIGTKLSNYKSVMPLNVRGCTRATLTKSA